MRESVHVGLTLVCVCVRQGFGPAAALSDAVPPSF